MTLDNVYMKTKNEINTKQY